MLPSKSDLIVCCAHPAYQIHDELAARNAGIRSFPIAVRDELPQRLGEADVLVISGFWRNDLLEAHRNSSSSSLSAPARTSSTAVSCASAASGLRARRA